MKHLVMIVGLYYPHPSPTGKCAGQYIDLLKDHYHIDVIYIRLDRKNVYGEIIGNEKLYGMANWRLTAETRFNEVSTKTGGTVTGKLAHLGMMLMKAIGYVQSKILFPNNLRWFYHKAFQTLCDIHASDPIDVVFTVNSPFSAHLAGERFKLRYPNVKWFAYTVDPFYVSSNYSRKNNYACEQTKEFLAEKRVLSNVDANFLSEEIYSTSKNLYEGIDFKTFPLPYVLSPSCFEKRLIFPPDKINLVYAGRFYKGIRNPEYLLNTFLLIDNPALVLHLYIVSDCDEVINDYIRQSSGRIIRHPQVSSCEIQVILNNSDILISVGNSMPEFKPSKIFEYISTGLPIIHFYYHNQKDNLLFCYDLALQVDMSVDPKLMASKIEQFCSNNKGRKIAGDDIAKKYHKYSKNSVRNIMNTAIEQL